MVPGPLRVPHHLRRLAALLIRGRDAPFVLGDLDEAYERERARGMSPGRAGRRYLANAFASALSMAWARAREGDVGTSWLDLKLGVRMLARQPGLTAVAVFALALGIPASLIPGQFVRAFRATLPFDEGARIVGVQSWDREASRPDLRSLHDFEAWRDELKSFESLGASLSDPYNVISEDGRAAPVRGAEVTASTFDILRVQPLLGRRLVAADELPGAPDVVVLGYDTWQSRVGGDPDVVGRTIRIGRTPHEVVGVMPRGFLFPVNDHLWLPLRARAVDYERGRGPEVRVFGRLADGVTLGEADAEVEAIGRRLAASYPDSHGHLRSQVVAYTTLGQDIDLGDTTAFATAQLVALLLLAVACGNVGILILARTAMRTSEIAVRTALGASRRRIVAQIFVETLVLALVAAGVGLAVGDLVATRFQRSLGADLPFWLDFGVTPRTVAWALGLAAGSAVIAGVVPALKATGPNIHRSLQRASAGASGIRFGGLSTALIVVEVAISVWFLTLGGTLAPGVVGSGRGGMGIDPSGYLSAGVRIPWIEPTEDHADAYEVEFREHVATTQRELARRLAAEPGVRGVAFADALPGEDNPGTWIEVEDERASDELGGHWVRVARVDTDFFRALRQPILSGRDFEGADGGGAGKTAPSPVIVNTTFVEEVLGGRSALGKRIRRVGRGIARGGGEPGPWLEIVGVVGHLGMYEVAPERDAGFYLPTAPGALHPVRVAVRTPGDPASFAARLRQIASEVDPTAIVGDPRAMDRVVAQQRRDARWGTLLFGLLASIAIVLSMAGLYALISFTVSERTREIGIRTALGAMPGRIAATVGRRAVLQLLGGIFAGAVLSLLVAPRMFSGPAMIHVRWPLLVGSVAGSTLLVGLLSCVPPTLRGVRIRPVDALKEG